MRTKYTIPFACLILLITISCSRPNPQIEEMKTIQGNLSGDSSRPDPRIEAMKTIQGNWSGDTADVKMVENWVAEDDHLYGTGWIMKNKDTLYTEMMEIEMQDGTPVFIAKVGNATPVVFTLITSENNTWVFENKEHDFPQRVAYILKSPTELNAYVEGLQDGKMVKEEFSYTKK